MAPAVTAAVSDLPPVDLGGRCEILPGSRLPELDSAGGKAYVAKAIKDRRTELFAIVTDRPVPARIDALPAFRGLDNPAVLRLADWGAVDWTPDRRRRFAVLYERPAGRRVMDDLRDTREPVPEDQIIRGLLPSLLLALRELNMRGVTCGGLNPTNLFFKDASTTGGVLIGDCLTVPPGYGQPLLVETIERGMAQPSGRGPGSIADDLYALGVTLLVLHLGRNPLRDLDDDAILKAKMDRGTYPALTAQVRLPQNLIEPLRGLMTDDPRQRWTMADLDLWLQGRRLSPKQPQVPRKGARPFEFGGEELMHCRALARAMCRNPLAAAPLIDRGDVDKWVRRAVGDEARAEALQAAISSASIGGRATAQEDRLVARAAIALDPPAPIRYRGLSVMPDGVGTALAEALWDGGGVQAFAELVLAQLPMFWANCQPEFRPEYVPMVQAFDGNRNLLEQTGPGFGVERLLYELAPACPCLSPQVASHYALTLPDLLLALDTVGAGTGRGKEPVDRHVAAFIATHHKKLNEKLLQPLAGGMDPGRRLVAMLHVLSDVQQRFGPARLPNLCGWFVSLMDPAFKRFKHRETRERLRVEAQRVAREGSLDGLIRLVDSPDAIVKDDKGFRQAQRRYESLTRQIDRTRAGQHVQAGEVEHNGRQVAAVVSSVVAGVVLLLTGFVMLGGR